MTDQTTITHGHTFQDQATRRVSFILTTRNKIQFIQNAMTMIRELVGPEDELIVVDGGSTDGTTEAITNCGDLVDVLLTEPDANPSHALNKGILLARGRYIKHITDDDQFFPDAVEQAVATFDAQPDVDVLLCGGTREVNGETSPFYVPPGANYGKSPEDVFKYGVCGCGTFFRRSAIPRIGLTDQTNSDSDGEHVARAIYNKATVRFCRINLFHHPIYEHSFIVAKQQEHQRDVNRTVRRYCSRWFYLKYLLKTSVLRNRILGTPAITGRNFVLAALARLGSKRAQTKLHPQEPIWDGGFS